jgi:hypothetical protein
MGGEKALQDKGRSSAGIKRYGAGIGPYQPGSLGKALK